MKRLATMLLVCAAFTAVAVGTTVGSAAPGKSDAAKAGGTYRVGWENAFGFTDAFDPTGEYLGDAFNVYTNLLVRTLAGYNHVGGVAGNRLVPDLATALPKPTNGGKTYTFHLKSGIKFAPPVNREITSADIAYAMQRLASSKDGAEYGFYYTSIKGWAAGANGGKISGITTPNARTIVFNLTQPVGDFLYRMGMPATGPIPQEVAKCFEGQPGKYGRNLVSSGPYMLAGSDKLDASSCSALKPASGFDGQTTMTLVRNPNYSPSTDSKTARENLPDSFVFTVDTNADDIYNRVRAGDLEDEVPGGIAPPKVLREYTTDPSLKPNMHVNPGDRTWYLPMTLTQPPFDDIHVRKALNLIMDKAALQRAWGGPSSGVIATHIVPDTILNNALKGFDPYKTPGEMGSVAKAAAEMKQSKYDPGHTGKCTAAACKGVLMIADTRAVDTRMVPIIESSAAKIGITFTVRTITGAYPTIQTPSKNIPISERPGWAKDYADASTFFNALFLGTAILPSGNTNYSLIGLTPALAKKLHITGTVTGIPNLDAQIQKCNRTQPRGLASAGAGDPRIACWAGVDRKLMTDVVPWVPYLFANVTRITGPKVAKWGYDQFGLGTAFAHVAVK
jgi:peptide/nickel transport system substrate-binding protein